MTGLRSSQVAEAAGVNRQTLRYYERCGLLAEPQRSPGGHRIYPPEAVTVLRVIKAAQRLGFTLDEVAALITPGGHRRGRLAAGLPEQARGKLDRRYWTLREAIAAGCDDLAACAGQPSCPIPFATSAVGASDGGASPPAARPAAPASRSALPDLDR